MGAKIRADLGHTGAFADGYRIDAECLQNISDPLHTLNRRGYYDPTRYDLKIAEVAALYQTILEGGIPDQIIVRINGMLPSKHPVYAYLRSTYPAGCKDPYDGSPQPAVEVLDGNTRQWLAVLAIAERAKLTLPLGLIRRASVQVVKNCTDEMAAQIFQETNANRQAPGWFQNLLIFRARTKEGLPPEEIAKRLHQPLRIVREFAIFDTVEDEIAKRYSAGGVTLARVRELAKLPRDHQLAALHTRAKAAHKPRGQGALTPLRLRQVAERVKSAGGYFTADDVNALLSYAAGERTVKLRAELRELVGEKSTKPSK